MGYRIRYTDFRQRRTGDPGAIIRVQLLASAALGAAVLLSREMLPGARAAIERLFLPGENTAMEAMAYAWSQGDSLRQSLILLCRGILEAAGYGR